MSAETDRELLEWAARAAGIEGIKFHNECGCYVVKENHWWNPLTDDGDALRLQVNRGFTVKIFQTKEDEDGVYLGWVEVWLEGDSDPMWVEHLEGRPMLEVVKYAIVRAAAEIGKAMKCSSS